MPQRSKRPCAHVGCRNLVTPPALYCETHLSDAGAYDRWRGSARERGYSSRWERIRLAYLRGHPLCEECEKQGRVTPAEQVHHKDGNVSNMSEDNLMSVCSACHNRITAKQHPRGER